MRTAELAAGPDCPRAVRNMVMRECIDHGCGIDTIERARLLASEVATNAVRHTPSETIRVVIDLRDDRRLCVEIEDDDPTEPTVRHAEADELTGRGMFLLEGLADTWGVECRHDDGRRGKTVWFTLDC